MQSFEKLKQLILDTQGDVDKATKGNKAACKRVRAMVQQLEECRVEIRKEALDITKA